MISTVVSCFLHPCKIYALYLSGTVRDVLYTQRYTLLLGVLLRVSLCHVLYLDHSGGPTKALTSFNAIY